MLENEASASAAVPSAPGIWERYLMAMDEVTERMRRIARAFDEAQVDYALVGGQAVALWVATKDPAAVRTTKDVDILLHHPTINGMALGHESDEELHRPDNRHERTLLGCASFWTPIAQQRDWPVFRQHAAQLPANLRQNRGLCGPERACSMAFPVASACYPA